MPANGPSNLVEVIVPCDKIPLVVADGEFVLNNVKIQRNVQVVAYFYDAKGNSVGGPYKGTVNPTVLKSLQLGAFSMKPSTSIMKGTPTFIRLEYQSIATS